MFQSSSKKFARAKGAPAANSATLSPREAMRAAIAMGGFALVVALLGGSWRPDVPQLIALRPLAALSLLPVFFWLTRDNARGYQVPLAFLAALASWMLLQLIPLPQAIWSALPTRATIAEIDALVGLEGVWRPIHLVPTRGWNALAALVVPTSALLLAIAVRAPASIILRTIAAMGVLNAALGILQVLSGGAAALHFYVRGSEPVARGIFANENHAAMFSAIVLVVIARLALVEQKRAVAGQWRLIYALSFGLVLVSVLLTDSRAGLAVSGFGLAVAAYLIVRNALKNSASSGKGASVPGDKLAGYRRYIMPALGTAGGVVLLLLLMLLAQSPAANGLVASAAFEDLRWNLTPILSEMAGTYWLLGTGFGSFEEVYHLFEPTALMIPQYINQAHNDWAQIVIEGGLPAVLILGGALGWLGLTLRQLWQSGWEGRTDALTWLGVGAILAASSLVDYPLRTPIFQVIVAWIIVAIAQSVRDKASADPARGFARTR